jgi:hypothetical protein
LATLNPQSRGVADNIVVTMAAASGGGDNVTDTNGPVMIIVANRDASSKTVTVASFATTILPGTAKANEAVVIPAGSVAVLGPYDVAVWGDSSSLVELTYSAVTSVFVGAYVPH